MKFVLLLVVSQLASPATADFFYWDYKDWSVTVEIVDTGEDLRVTCTAHTGGDGDPSFGFEVSNGDALPPHFFPTPFLSENAPRPYPTQMQQGQRVWFQSDRGWQVQGSVSAGISETGLAWAIASAPQADSHDMLREMRQARQMWISLNGDVVYGASLSGFTAAYGKVAEQCGFPTSGVL